MRAVPGVLSGVGVSLLLLCLSVGGAAGEPMKKRTLSLEDARKAGAAAAAEARKNKWNVAIAVVDDGGHLVWFERLDDAIFAGAKIAIGKAQTAAAFKRPTKALEDAVNSGQNAILTFPDTLPREGGVPIVVDGKMLGAIGVSGAKSSEDAQAAAAGAAALTSQ